MADITIDFPPAKEEPRPIESHAPKGVEKGEPGVSYFLAGTEHRNIKVFLDGVDVTNRCTECSTVGGWCVMFEIEDKAVRTYERTVYHGKVEVTVDGRKA